MRIALLSTFYPLRGGIAQFSASLYRAFEKQHDVKAFTFSRQYPQILFPGQSQYVSSEDRADKIPSVEVLDSINPFSYRKTARAIADFEPDILLMNYWMTFLAPSLGWTARALKKRNPKSKVITVLHNVVPHEKRIFDTALTKYFLKSNDGFIVMSETNRKALLRVLPDARYASQALPIFNHFGEKMSPASARAQLGIDANKKTLLFFGFIRPYKGLSLLLDTVATLPANEYQLVIAGECYGSFDPYMQQIERLGIKDRVTVRKGYISDGEVPLFFSAADVCVLPYLSATQSGITSIAYHFDVPMIATDVGGLKESILHEKTGLLVPRPEAGLVAEAIQRFYAEGLQSAFQKHIQALKADLSWESLADTIVELRSSL